MDEVFTRARLLDPAAPELETQGLTTTLLRSEVEEAREAGDEAELVLDVARPGGESKTVRVSWRQEDLDVLLRRAAGDEVTLTFDRRELEQAFDADVEAHGMREKAAILTVALAGASAFTGSASAMLAEDAGVGGGAPVAAASGSWQSDAASSGLTGAPSEAAAATSSWQSDAASSGLTGAPAAGNWQTDAASTGTPSAPIGEPSGGEGITAPSPAQTGALAGFALLITGAAFVIRGQRRRERPA